MEDIIKKIDTPEELLDFMNKNIKYGYLGKNGKIYHEDDTDFNSKWYSEYVLESPNDVLNNLCGNCFDQVELEREWFLKHNYEIKTIFEMVKLEYKNNYQMHAFLVYKDKSNNWNWFENADFNNRGIYTFNTLESLLKFQHEKYLELLKKSNIKDEEKDKIIITEFTKPKEKICVYEYLEHVLSQDIIEVTK